MQLSLKMKKYKDPLGLQVKHSTEKVLYVDTDQVSCSGEHNDHPKVYYTIPTGKESVCGYCGIIFRKRELKDF